MKAVCKTEKENVRNRPDRTKRTILILTAVALTLILIVGGGIWSLLSMLNNGNAAAASESADLASYLSEKWPVFQLRSWQQETGTLELDYPLRFTYVQMQKYGRTLDELKDLPSGNITTVSALKTAAYEDIGAMIWNVTVFGVTSDSQIAYTVYPDGAVKTCWDDP